MDCINEEAISKSMFCDKDVYMMRKTVAAILAAVILCGFSGCQSGTRLDPQNPVNIKIWTYYNGSQQEAFDKLVSDFNGSTGLEMGIIAENISQGSISDLSEELLRSASGDVNGAAMPNLAMTYPETAMELDKLNLLADMDDLFTKDELKEFIPAFIEEGRLVKDGPLRIMPVAKSTEILAVNKTDWDKFAKDTGTDTKALSTIEGLTATGEKYFNWTAEQAGNELKGKALFARDAIDNYMLVGSAQLGQEIFSRDGTGEKVNLDKETIRTLWDNYYVPFIKGYFASEGKFGSDDIKTGKVITYVGSSASMGYFPTKVSLEDDSTYPIEAMILPAPYFEKAEVKYSIQQGAGLCTVNKSDEENYAAAQFIKWFTMEEQNMSFSVNSSYMPVTISATAPEKIKSAFSGQNSFDKDALLIAAETFSQGETYISKPFDGMINARSKLKFSMLDKAKEDRKTVVEEIKAGKDLNNAAAKFTDDENFEKWYIDLSAQIMKEVK